MESWSQQAKLTASDGLVNDGFGISANISGDYAVVGATGEDSGDVNLVRYMSLYAVVQAGPSKRNYNLQLRSECGIW